MDRGRVLWQERRRRLQRPIRTSGCSRWIIVTGVAVALLLVGCSSQPEIERAEVSGDGTSLVIMMASCNADYSLSVSESSDEVRVIVIERDRHSSLWCDAGAGLVGPVQLDEPLGDRVVFDGGRDIEIPVSYWPWNQTRYSDAEYLAAMQAAARCVEGLEPQATVAVATSDDGYAFLDVVAGEPDAEQSSIDATEACFERHVEPLRH